MAISARAVRSRRRWSCMRLLFRAAADGVPSSNSRSAREPASASNLGELKVTKQPPSPLGVAGHQAPVLGLTEIACEDHLAVQEWPALQEHLPVRLPIRIVRCNE